MPIFLLLKFSEESGEKGEEGGMRMHTPIPQVRKKDTRKKLSVEEDQSTAIKYDSIIVHWWLPGRGGSLGLGAPSKQF